jgi:hypothetical protein
MNLRNNKNQIVLDLSIIFFLAIGFIWYILFTDKKEDATISQIPANINEYIGTISSSTDGRNVYISNKYDLQFIYPEEWRVGDNHLGYGTFQIFNYDESEATGSSIFPKGWNKIEIAITSNSTVDTSPEYPEINRITKEVLVGGQPATRVETEFTGGVKILSYKILLPTISNKYLSMSMYGDSSNFYILDEIVKSLIWIRR